MKGVEAMCVGVVMKISYIEGGEALGELYGVTKRIRIDLVEGLALNDYVLVHAGFAIGKINKAEAIERMSLLREVFNL